MIKLGLIVIGGMIAIPLLAALIALVGGAVGAVCMLATHFLLGGILIGMPSLTFTSAYSLAFGMCFLSSLITLSFNGLLFVLGALAA